MSGFRGFGGLGFIGIEKGLAPRVLTEGFDRKFVVLTCPKPV